MTIQEDERKGMELSREGHALGAQESPFLPCSRRETQTSGAELFVALHCSKPCSKKADGCKAGLETLSPIGQRARKGELVDCCGADAPRR